VTGALIEDLDLPSLSPRGQGPPSSAQSFDRNRAGPSIEKELPEWCPWNDAQTRGECPPIYGDALAVDDDLDDPTIQDNGVLHAGSSTATVSTWVVWGKRSNACTAVSRRLGNRWRSRARVAGSHEI
jgi:hypothetical protein